MNAKTYLELKEQIIRRGYGNEVTWAENIEPCTSARTFAHEFIYVVCNSGMKQEIASKIYKRVMERVVNGKKITDKVFRNKPKRKAIQLVYDKREQYFQEYLEAQDKLAYIETLPYMGKIIKYHLAKNLGIECIKPDRHLTRIAQSYGMTPEAMCRNLADALGEKLVVVDSVIWRAANLGLI